jgi:CubicO group peptidase (beta-lactamase class C family)
MMRVRSRSFLIGLLFVALMVSPVRAQETPLNGLDEYVNRALKEWEVPGVAIAVIKNDKVVFAKGYGVRKIGDPTPVDEKTLFAIGSASKAFTAAAVAMLADEGKLKFDDPATRHLPGFQLYDPYVTREITVRDLLCHRSGLERGEMLWYGTNYDRDEILRRVRYLKPSWSFRSRFGYQNIMYLAAGQAVARVSGKSWDEFIRERIFRPLGMTASSTSILDLKSSTNVATPHAKLEGKVESIAWRNIDNIAPAGSINSNVVDMAQWVRLQLGGGKYENAQVISSGSVKEMHQPHTIIRQEPPWSLLFPGAHFLEYGLGWFLHDHHGRKVVQHGGNIDGMSALVAMIPEEKLGVVVLTNMNGTILTTALAYKIFDLFLQAPARDWSADLLKLIKAQEGQAAQMEKKQAEERVKDTRPSLAQSKYVGTYINEMYGEARVTEENGRLVVSYSPVLTGDLEHWHYDTFQARMRNPQIGKVLINFTINAQGKTESLKFNTPVASDLVFTRAPEKAADVAGIAMSEDALKKYVGKYESKAPPIEISIEFVGGKLRGVIPGQPIATLVPISENRFKVVVEGVPVEIFAQFDVADGKAKTMTLEQAGMKFTLTPKP